MFWRRSEHPDDEELSAFSDGELARGRVAAVEEHLGRCEACRARLEELTSVRAMLSAMPEEQASRSFRLTPAMAGVTPKPVVGRPRGYAFAPAMALSLLVALLFVDFAVIGGGSDSLMSRTANDGFAPTKQQQESTAGAAASEAAPKPAAAIPPSVDAAGPPATRQSFNQDSSAPQAPSVAAAAPAPVLSPSPGPSAAQAPAPAATATGESLAATLPDDAASPAADTASGDSRNENRDARGLIRLLEVIAAGAFVGSLLAVWRTRMLSRR